MKIESKQTSRKMIMAVSAAIIVGFAVTPFASAFSAGQSETTPAVSGELIQYQGSAYYRSGQFKVKNNSTAPVSSFELGFQVDGEFSAWSANFQQAGNKVTLQPKTAIAAGQTAYIDFGINGSGNNELNVTGCSLNGAAVAGCASGEEDTQKPTIPGNLTADTVNSSTIHVMWSHSSDNIGVAGYKLFQDGPMVQDIPGNTRMVNVSGLEASTEYRFEVQAYDAAGNHSDKSAPVIGKTAPAGEGDTEKPSTPTMSGVVLGVDSVELEWSAASDNVAVTGYEISQDGHPVATVDQATLKRTIRGLKAETEYTFSVKAYDAAGNFSDASNPVVLKTETGEVIPGDGEPPANFTVATRSFADANVAEHLLVVGFKLAEGNQTKRYEIWLNGERAQTALFGSPTGIIGNADNGIIKHNVRVGNQANTTFQVKVRVMAANGKWSDFTDELSVTTGENK